MASSPIGEKNPQKLFVGKAQDGCSYTQWLNADDDYEITQVSTTVGEALANAILKIFYDRKRLVAEFDKDEKSQSAITA